MATIRKHPFGYGIHMGKIVISEAEGPVVRQVFADYANGASYQQIAGQFNALGIPYDGSGRRWNKNIIDRMLHNKVYMGTETYPCIVSLEEMERATAAKPQAGPTDKGMQIKAIRRFARCTECGGELECGRNYNGWSRWKCRSCGWLASGTSDEHVRTQVHSLLTTLIIDPDLVQSPPHTPNMDRIKHVEDEFHQMISTPGFDEDAARAAALTLAAERFSTMGSADYETMRIHHILADAEQMEGLDTELLRKITRSILIQPDGSVRLVLKNGQIIHRYEEIST